MNLRIAEAPVELHMVQPQRLPDLFYGEELIVLGRYRGTGTGSLVITGERSGKQERIEITAAFGGQGADGDYIPRLWAARRIGELTRRIRLEGGEPAGVDEVRQLGLRHGILTEYTSYLVQEPDAVAAAPMTREERQRATGQAAVERASASAKLSDAKSLVAADEVAQSRADLPVPAADTRLAGRVFQRAGPPGPTWGTETGCASL